MKLIPIIFSVFCLVFVGCNKEESFLTQQFDPSPIDPGSVTKRIHEILDIHVGGSSEAAGFLEEGKLNKLFRALDSSCDLAQEDHVYLPIVDPLKNTLSSLQENIFSVAKSVEEDELTISYVFTGQDTCNFAQSALAFPWIEEELCDEFAEKNPLLFRVQMDSDKVVKATLLAGKGRHEVMVLKGHNGQISGSYDLDVLSNFHANYVLLSGEKEAPSFSRLGGKFEYDFVNPSPGVHRLSVSVAKDFELNSVGNENYPEESALNVKIPAGQKIIEYFLDRDAGIARASVHVASPVLLSFPLTSSCTSSFGEGPGFSTECEYGENSTLNFNRMVGSVEFDENKGAINFVDLSFGDNSVVMNAGDTEVLSASLDAGDKDSLSGSLFVDEEDVVLQVDPGMDFQMATAFQDKLGDDSPEWIQDAMFDVMLSGESVPEMRTSLADVGCLLTSEGSGNTQIRLSENASLNLTETHNMPSNPALSPLKMDVEGGMCLSFDDSGLLSEMPYFFGTAEAKACVE